MKKKPVAKKRVAKRSPVTHYLCEEGTAWCGVKATASKWPITCQKCCRAIRKARLRQIELELKDKLTRSQRAEAASLKTAIWPNHPPHTPMRHDTISKKTLVTGDAKRWPKDLTFTSKDISVILEFLLPDTSPNVLKRLWITEDEEHTIQKALEVHGVVPQRPRAVHRAYTLRVQQGDEAN